MQACLTVGTEPFAQLNETYTTLTFYFARECDGMYDYLYYKICVVCVTGRCDHIIPCLHSGGSSVDSPCLLSLFNWPEQLQCLGMSI